MNIILTLLTLGIYFPFAKTNVRKYFWNHLEVHGEKFQYTGTGIEILKGYALVFAAYIGFIGLNKAITSYAPEAIGVLYLALVIIAIWFIPMVIIGSRAYLLSRTKLRGIRFGVDRKGAKELRMVLLKGILFSVLTLGFYNIVLILRIHSTIINNSYYGDKKFYYEGDTMEFFWMNFIGIIFSYLTLGIYFPWLVTKNIKFHANNTSLQGMNFNIDLEGQEVLFLYLKNFFLIIFTLGLAIPWVIVMNLTFYMNKLSFNGDFDYSTVGKCEIEASGILGDTFGDSLDLDVGI
jgi:uncharacterized membrane protein YjgN (DUF898 family)